MADINMGGTEQLIQLDEGVYQRLRCPSCGNRGASSFSADTFVLLRGDGVPVVAGAYTEGPDPQIDCHACDHVGPLRSFTDGDGGVR